MILAIDPGNEKSAYVVLEDDLKPGEFGKVSCAHVRDIVIPTLVDLYPGITLAIEMVASYGMPVGREVFETCFWAGMFWQAANVKDKRLIYRIDEKLTLCRDSRAKDANIRQALIDRFAYGVPNKGKGTKKEPGWFYGFSADVWQAYAVGVTCADMMEGRYKRSESQGAKRADG